MVSVRIDGEHSSISGEHLPRLIDLVELIKDYIVPSHMITGLLIDGRVLEDQDWDSAPGHFGNAILDVSTGSPARYIYDKIPTAPEVIDNCFSMFRETRKAFIEGSSQSGNELLRAAVANMQAFVGWYRSILELMPDDQKRRFCIDDEITAMIGTLERMCMQQLTQSWKATGDTIGTVFEPQLESLHSRLRLIVAEEPVITVL